MQKVTHNFRTDRSIGTEELIPKVEIQDILSILELGDNRIDLLYLRPSRVGRVFASGKNALKQEGGLRTASPILLDDESDRVGYLLHRIPRKVIGANEQNDQLGVESVDLSLAKTPKQMLGAIPGDTEIEGSQFIIMSRPSWKSIFGSPKGRNGVAIKN